MIGTLIIEDEAPAAKRLEKLLKEVEPSITILETIESVSSAIKWFEQHSQPDLLMLDIQLADGLSFDIFKQVRIDSFVIFTTAYDEYAIKAFELNSIDYLLKPIHRDKLRKSIEKFIRLQGEKKSIDIQAVIAAMDRGRKTYKQRFAVNVGTKIKSIETTNIAYFYSMEKHTFLCTKENRHYPINFTLDKLEELGLDDNTIVIFMSDNGGNMYDVVEGSTPTNNAPLRGGKGNIYEGGTRCPCIVAWPGVTKPASKSEGIISTIDFYPTMLDMAGIKPNPVQLIDGVSFTGLLRGRKDLDRQAIFWHFPRYVQATQNLPASSVRKGDYKLIRFYGEGPDRSNAFELYDLKNDIGEKKNLAEKYPQKVKELDRLIDGFIEDTGSLVPGKNPEYIPFKKGWSCSKDCSTTVRDGILTLQSKGNDPYIYTYDTPCVSGRMQVKFKMRSSIKGPAAIFYTGNGGSGKGDNFPIDNSVNFEVESNRKWKEYTVVLNVRGELGGLRIDPGGSIGAAEIAWIELSRLYGPVLKKWNF